VSTFSRLGPAVLSLGGMLLHGSTRALDGSGARRALRVCAALACSIAAGLTIGAVPALGEVGHSYLCQITGTSPGSASECHSGGSATPSGLSSPWGLTISNGNLWVASQGNSTVDEYDSTGAFVSQQTGGGQFSGSYVRGVAVDDATQTLYVADSGPDAVDVFNKTGGFVTQWKGTTTPSGSFGGGYVSVAVDNSTGSSSGDVYVTDSSHEVIDKLDSSGNPVAFSGSAAYIAGSQLTGTPSGPFAFNSSSSDAITVDSSGNIYVADNGNNVVDEFSSSGTFVQSFTGSATPTGSFASVVAVGVDSAGDVYVVDQGNDAVDEFSSSGTFIGQLTGAASPAASFVPQGVAVDSSGDVYVSDVADSVIDKFGPAVLLPTPTTGTASSITPTTATVSGSVDPAGGGNVTSCQFDYGTSPTFGQTASCSPATPYASVTSVSASLTGLAPDTTYYFRVAAGNAKGGAVGSVQTFTTTGPPTVDSESTANVLATSVTLQAAVNPHGFDTTCEFQYVTDAAFTSSGYSTATTVPCTPSDLGPGTSDVSASANLTGLQPNTIYHFRVVATSSQASVGVDGSDQTFTTSPPVSIDSESASAVTQTGATLNAEINPEGFDTTCQFQYVTDAAFMSSGYSTATTVACSPSDLGSGVVDVSASAQISGLTLGTTYHFRAVGTNSLAPGGVDGSDTTFTTLPAVSIDSESASAVTQTGATLNAEINPEGFDTTCQFQYVTDAAFMSSGYSTATTVACSPSDLGSGVGDVSASAQISGLTVGTTYHFRAVGTNSLAPGGVDGSDTTFETLPPLSVDSESVTGVTDTGATLGAQINPLGVDTTYQFAYETDAVFKSSGGLSPAGLLVNATIVPAKPVDLGSGSSDVAASVDLTGLTPGTKYHFQVIGTNSDGVVPGAAKTFTTLSAPASTGLPDDRAYELVSPVNMAGGEVHNALCSLCTTQAAPNGNQMAYFSLISFPGSAGPGDNYIATRGTTGWATQALIPPQAPGTTLELSLFIAYSSDLSKAVLENGGGQNGSSSGQDDPPLVPGTCTVTPPAVPTTPCTGEPSGFTNLFVRDNTHGKYQLVDSAAGAPSGVTLANANFDGASSDLSHVVFDENTSGGGLTAHAPAGDNLYDWSSGAVNLVGMLPPSGATTCGPSPACSPVGGGTLGGSGRILNAVSANGSTVVFTDNGNLYARVGDATTTQLDAPAPGAPGPGGGGGFMTASTDGSVVLFTDAGSAGLTSDTVAGDTNLYEYNFNAPAGHQLTDLTTSAGSAGVDGVVGASSDGSYVYFVAHGVPNSGNENLYVEHDGGTPTLIATLNGADSSDWSGSYTARVTPDGKHLAFNSINPLTGYDNTDANTGSADTEVFLYDATSGTLVCASCNPTGTNPIGSSQLDPIEPGELAPGNEYMQHNLSDDGSRLFFDSNDALSPHDTNGKQDVYEYENGQIRLISTGTSVDDSTFMDASANGNDVFFVTRQQLVPQATDADRYDLYDARVGGGFPVPPPPPPCTGDGCKPATPPPPPVLTIATVTFVGPGNATPGAPTAKVAVSSKKLLRGFKFSVVVLVPRKGKIRISGVGLKTVKKSVKRGGSYKLTVGLTALERNALTKKGKRKLKITVRVGYKPATGKSSTATFSVTVRV